MQLFGDQNWKTVRDYVQSFLAVCASLYWLHILCSPHRVVMPTQLPYLKGTSQFLTTEGGGGGGGDFFFFLFSKLSGNATQASRHHS